MSVARPAEWEDEGDVVWLVHFTLACSYSLVEVFNVQSTLSTPRHQFFGRVSIARQGSRMSSQAAIYFSELAFGSVTQWLSFLSLMSCDPVGFLVVRSSASVYFSISAILLFRNATTNGKWCGNGNDESPHDLRKVMQGRTAVSMPWPRSGGFR